MIDVADANATYYYHFDGLGSVVALTDGSGDAVQLYEYSIFGEVSASDPNHPNRFLFTGREFDSETGLYYYRARYYNPYIGRFLQTDPAGDGMNRYAYCANSPVNWLDPSGLRWEDPAIRIIFFDSTDAKDPKQAWGDSMAASDPFWDISVDISGKAAEAAGYAGSSYDYLMALFSGSALKDKIMAEMPRDPYDPNKPMFDWVAQVSIEGIWFLGHGSTYGDNPLAASGNIIEDSDESFWGAVGQALNNNNGLGATIHIRQCTVDEAKAYDRMEAIAVASGHAVTIPLGDFWVLGTGVIWDPPYFCTSGFGIATPYDDYGVASVSTNRYYGYKATVLREIYVAQGIKMPVLCSVRQNSWFVY
jgi:RHS repeat-associated protein